MSRTRMDEVNGDDPLSYAVSERDRNVLRMVEEALKAGRVMLAYQPVIAATGGAVAFNEGLVRVLDSTGRIIPAAQFISVIETIELGREIDVAALRCGLETLSRHPDLRLSINMSARSIGYSKWMQTLKRALAKDPTVGERLILEITESSAMLVPELVRSFMIDLQDRGITFALDDFGAGQTSLRHLKDLYFDILKIDSGFITDCDTDPDNQCILEAVLTIARQFDMFTVAEGVETAAEAATIVRLGADCLQGFYYGAPKVNPPWLDTIPSAFVQPRSAKA